VEVEVVYNLRTSVRDLAAACGGPPRAGDRPSRQCGIKVTARLDLELAEDLAEMPLHRPRAKEQLSTDLGVRPSIASQLGYLLLLRREFGAVGVRSPTQFLSSRLQLATGTLGEPHSRPSK